MNLYAQPEVREYLQEKVDQLKPRVPTVPGADMLFRPGDREYQMPYMFGASMGKQAPKIMAPAGNFVSELGHDMGGTTLKGIALGGLLGAGMGAMRGGNIGRSALMGAGGAGVLTYLLNRLAQSRDTQLNASTPAKRAFYGLGDSGSDPVQLIEMKVYSDPHLSSQQQSALTRLLPQLSPSQLQTLSSVVRSASGAGVGYVIAKFLLGLGFTGTTLLSLAGAYAGSLMGGNPSNALGQQVDTQHDAFGRQRIV